MIVLANFKGNVSHPFRAVFRFRPYFADLPALWKTRHPKKQIVPDELVDDLALIAHFAAQFPEDAG